MLISVCVRSASSRKGYKGICGALSKKKTSNIGSYFFTVPYEDGIVCETLEEVGEREITAVLLEQAVGMPQIYANLNGIRSRAEEVVLHDFYRT